MKNTLSFTQLSREMQTLNSCPGPKLCTSCQLFNKNAGFCGGCTPEYSKRCLKRDCYSNCNICGGGKHATVPSCCGRSPLHKIWVELFKTESTLNNSPALDIHCRIVPVVFAQIAKHHIPDMFPAIDAWAVPVHKAMNLEGKFRSQDMKDYLGIPEGRKLILSTCGPDNYMEMLWRKGARLNYKRHGIDYWFPAHFSIYDNDSKFYQFYNAKRQQIHARRVKSQFTWFRLGEHIPLRFLHPIRDSSAILISCQQMYSKHNRDILNNEITIADRWFPQRTKIFFIGKSRISLSNFKKDRMVYSVNEHWLLLALKGRTMDNRPAGKLSTKELLINNLQEIINGTFI